MTFTTQPKTPTAFENAYNLLSEDDRERFRSLVMMGCGVSKGTFYDWLKNPDQISKSDKFQIALLLNKDPREIFKTQKP